MAHLQSDVNQWRKSILEKKETDLITRTFENRAHVFDPQIHDVANVEKRYPEIKRSTHFIPMSLPQMFEYLRNQKKNPKIWNQ